jgi:hypothetical protein
MSGNFNPEAERQLIMIEQLKRELNSTVGALNSTPSYPPQGDHYQHQFHYNQPMTTATTTNKFGYDGGSQAMLDLLRSSQETSARLQVDHQLALSECNRLHLKNLSLKRRPAPGLLFFYFLLFVVLVVHLLLSFSLHFLLVLLHIVLTLLALHLLLTF